MSCVYLCCHCHGNYSSNYFYECLMRDRVHLTPMMRGVHPTPMMTNGLNKVLTEFLSLTLELFRYQGNSTNSSDPVLKCLVTIVGSLTRLSAVIRSSTSILVLKKYSSVLLKLFDGPFLSMEVMISLPACLLMLASTQYLQLAWRDWNDTVSVAHTNEPGSYS